MPLRAQKSDQRRFLCATPPRVPRLITPTPSSDPPAFSLDFAERGDLLRPSIGLAETARCCDRPYRTWRTSTAAVQLDVDSGWVLLLINHVETSGP